jgi:predicted NBD/HSP70 family sugar kinase
MGLQVELMNAANACLLAELWSGKLDGIRNAVLITVSEGIGAAILANGLIVSSRSGLAGEFGHSPMDPAGPLVRLWTAWMLGGLCVFKRRASILCGDAPGQTRHINIHELLRLAEEEDPVAIAKLYLARLLVSAAG